MASLMEQARNLSDRVLTSTAAFSDTVLFSTPANVMPSVSVTCNALCIKHSLGIDTEGCAMIANTARVTVSEKALNDLGYPVRNNNNVVAIKGHLVQFTDSQGILYKAIITETMPGRTIGQIVCTLGNYKP